MTYSAVETSLRDGNPVELYKFTLGITDFLYNDSDTDVTYNSETYKALTIFRTVIDQNDEINRSGLKITVPRDNDLADVFRVYAPAEVVSVSVFRGHLSDGNFVNIWSGRVISCDWSGAKANLECESVFSSLKRPGLRRNYQAQCPHVLYGVACGLNQLSHQTTDTVSVISGNTVSVPAVSGFADDYFKGGFLQFYTQAGLGQVRFITEHTSDVLTLVAPITELSVGDSVNVFPGCKHTLDDCTNKFNNLVNYGGFPYVPTVNPFGGGSAF